MKKFLLIILFALICFFLFITARTEKVQKETVSFSSWGSQTEVKILKEILSDFENETGIIVNFQHIPQNYFQKIHLLFASNLEPDVIFINNHYIKMYTDANLLENLTQILEDENAYHKVALDCFKSKDKIYAIPRDISALVLYVNKNIVKEKIKPKTIYDLKNIVSKYTNEEHWGINYEEDPLFWLYYLASNGGGVISDDLKEIIINKKESLDALNLYSDYANRYHIAPTKSEIGSMTTAQMFINGKLAVYLGGRWMLPKFKKTISFPFEVIEFPSSKDNKVYVDASGWAISKKSKNKENAIKLVKYLSSEESITKLSKSDLITPARKIKQNNEFETFTTMLNNAKPTPTTKYYGKINDILKSKTEGILSGKERAEDIFCEKTVKELEGLL